jgi:hypothetical protein
MDLVDDPEQRQRQAVSPVSVGGERAGLGRSARERVCKKVGVAQRVGDAVGTERVLEVAGITDERPTRAERLAEITLQPRKPTEAWTRGRARKPPSELGGGRGEEREEAAVRIVRQLASAAAPATNTHVCPSLVGIMPAAEPGRNDQW